MEMLKMFKDILNKIMNDLCKIEQVDKNALFETKVKSILDASYQSYCHDLKVNYDYLLYRDTLKVIKNIKREKMKREKNNEV